MPLIATRGAAAAKGFGLTSGGAAFIEATGGTVTEDGDYKIHTFNSTGTFEITANEGQVDYLVVAGGGNGGSGDGNFAASAGGAGGLRLSSETYTPTPLSVGTGLTLTPGTFPVTVGGGTANSTFSTITSLLVVAVLVVLEQFQVYQFVVIQL